MHTTLIFVLKLYIPLNLRNKIIVLFSSLFGSRASQMLSKISKLFSSFYIKLTANEEEFDGKKFTTDFAQRWFFFSHETAMRYFRVVYFQSFDNYFIFTIECSRFRPVIGSTLNFSSFVIWRTPLFESP